MVSMCFMLCSKKKKLSHGSHPWPLPAELTRCALGKYAANTERALGEYRASAGRVCRDFFGHDSAFLSMSQLFGRVSALHQVSASVTCDLKQSGIHI